jgi:hypothetical protein
MNDSNITRMFLTTAVLAAVAALLAVPAQAMFLDDGGAVVTSEPQAAPGSPIPDLSRVDAYASRFSEESSLTGDSALTRVDRAVAAADKAFETWRDKTAIAAREALQSPTQTAPGAPGTIPYLSHGIGVDESLFSGQQPSVGLTGDSALTRGDMPSSSTTQAVSSSDDFDWMWVGVGGGLAALAAAMGGFYLSARHRGRIALP